MSSPRYLGWWYIGEEAMHGQIVESDQEAMQKIAELHIEALECGRELTTSYTRITTKEEDTDE
jgi:hypothetical protein